MRRSAPNKDSEGVARRLHVRTEKGQINENASERASRITNHAVTGTSITKRRHAGVAKHVERPQQRLQ
jgi:hypothetical protein